MILTYSFRVEGALTDATYIKFGDRSDTVGLRRISDGEELIAPGTAFTRVSTGVYQYDLGPVSLEEDVSYEYFLDVLFDSEHTYVQKIINATGDEQIVVTIMFCIIKDGALYQPVDAPTLANPSSTFGVKSLTNGRVAIQSGGSFANTNGLYARSVDSASDTEKFQYYIKAMGEYVVGTTKLVNSNMLAIGRYTNSWKVCLMYGWDNVHMWLNGPSSTMEEPVDYALRAWGFIDEAEGLIDAAIGRYYFRGDGLTTDFVDGVPQLIKTLATMYAGVLMYEALGVTAYDTTNNQVQHRLRWQRKSIEDQLKKIRNGVTKISGGIVQDNFPTAYVSDPVRPLHDVSRFWMGNFFLD